MAPLWFRELRSVLVTGKVGVAHAKSIGTPIFMGAITIFWKDFTIKHYIQQLPQIECRGFCC